MSAHKQHEKPAAATTPVDPNYDPVKHPVIAKPEKMSQAAWDAYVHEQAIAQALVPVEDAFVKANKGKASEESLRASFKLVDGNDRDDLADAQRIDRLQKAGKAASDNAGLFAGWFGKPTAEQVGAQAVASEAQKIKRETHVSDAELGQLTAVALGQKPKAIGTPSK